jgi:anti-sigma factor (TIGR02949 family)
MAEPDNIGCEEALRRLAEFVDRELAQRQHDEVEHHLRTCRSCFSRMEFEQRLKDHLSVLSSESAPTASTDRIRKLIKGF